MDITRDQLDDFFQGLKTQFRAGQAQVDSFWREFCTVVRSSTAQELYRWMDTIPTPREFVGSRVVQNIATDGFTVVNKKYELTFEVPRDDIKDDNLGIYSPLTQDMAIRMAEHKDRLVADLLNDNTATGFDGKALLAGDHPVGSGTRDNQDSGGGGPYWYLMDTRRPMRSILMQIREDDEFVALTSPDDENVFMRDSYLYGMRNRFAVAPGFWWGIYASNQDLTAANFESALEAMMGLTDKNSNPMNIRPDTLMVPTNRRTEALEVLRAERDASGATNINRNALPNLIVNSFLSTT